MLAKITLLTNNIKNVANYKSPFHVDCKREFLDEKIKNSIRIEDN